MPVETPVTQLGAAAPDFELRDVVGHELVRRSDYEGRPLLVIFMCAHCPYVVHLEHQIAAIGIDYMGTIGIVGICSNDPVVSPGDAPARLADQYGRISMSFPYLHDPTQDAARAFGAVCTPDVFLYDRDHRLVYRGQIDSSRPSTGGQPTGADLRAAIEAVLAGEAPSAEQRPSVGCGIKWSQPVDEG